ncbi:growth arrest-specific protein 1-like [Salvelinus fontinalis]|uniref:growth arrest-specific protein 1-like n=1 Tax=Salvelinus fontinalis TaxID=8038 RepID=UPI002485DCC5|nr:growth arrest-specific protein 1-like [Salvelinus fontinalis]
MASFAGFIKWTGRSTLYLCCAFALFGCLCIASPTHGRRLICWQAIMKCHGESECHYAYDQYLYACAPVINGDRKKCPSHCISSLIQLNLTETGPSLEDCDCASDPVCRSTKRAIEPCLPRTSNMGCTEARRQCERDSQCSSAMRDYLFHCRKLFGGERCSDDCRRVIANMRNIPKAQQLDTCVCDGTERTICEYVKVSMKNFCFDSMDRYAGSGFSDSEDDSEDDYDEMEDYIYVENKSFSPRSACQGVVWTASVATILVLMNLI